MTKKGVVRGLRENLLVIAPEKNISCFGCMNQECRNSGGLISAENPPGLLLEAGQEVELEASGVSILRQAAASLLPPLVGFAAAYSLMRVLFPASGEGAAAFAGLVCLFAACFIVYRLRGKFPASMEYRVTRIAGREIFAPSDVANGEK